VFQPFTPALSATNRLARVADSRQSSVGHCRYGGWSRYSVTPVLTENKRYARAPEGNTRDA
jgi:hypothetical protein